MKTATVTTFAEGLIEAFIEDLATLLTCHEADLTADLYRDLGMTIEADEIIRHHSSGDEPEDTHYRERP